MNDLLQISRTGNSCFNPGIKTGANKFIIKVRRTDLDYEGSELKNYDFLQPKQHPHDKGLSKMPAPYWKQLTEIAQKLPDKQQEKLFVDFMTQVQVLTESETPPVLLSPLETSLSQQPDLSEIPLWGGKKKDGSPIKWLDKYYKPWLKRRNNDKNYIYRQDILGHDPKLVAGVAGEAYKKGEIPSNYIPTRSDYFDYNINDLGLQVEENTVAKRTLNTLATRINRKLQANAL